MRTICLFFAGVSLSACAHTTASLPPAEPEESSAATLAAETETAQREYAAMKYAGRHSFNRGAAAATLGQESNDISVCLKPNEPQGTGHAKIVFDPSGHAASVDIDQPPFDTAPSNICIKTIFYRATVPPFEGAPVPVGKSFTLGVDEIRAKSEEDERAADQAISAIDFSKCNPHNYEPSKFYFANVSFAEDGSVAIVDLDSFPKGDDATCIEKKIRTSIHMPALKGSARWTLTKIYFPVTVDRSALNP